MTEHQPDWPTPEFDRPDVSYECADCSEVVNPKNGDKQAALLIAGATHKLCPSCAAELRKAIQP